MEAWQLSVKSHQVVCQVCGRQFVSGEITPARFVRPAIVELIRHRHSDWQVDGDICQNDQNRYRSEYVQRVLTEEMGELTELEQEVVESLLQHHILARNVYAVADEGLTTGERLECDRTSVRQNLPHGKSDRVRKCPSCNA